MHKNRTQSFFRDSAYALSKELNKNKYDGIYANDEISDSVADILEKTYSETGISGLGRFYLYLANHYPIIRFDSFRHIEEFILEKGKSTSDRSEVEEIRTTYELIIAKEKELLEPVIDALIDLTNENLELHTLSNKNLTERILAGKEESFSNLRKAIFLYNPLAEHFPLIFESIITSARESMQERYEDLQKPTKDLYEIISAETSKNQQEIPEL